MLVKKFHAFDVTRTLIHVSIKSPKYPYYVPVEFWPCHSTPFHKFNFNIILITLVSKIFSLFHVFSQTLYIFFFTSMHATCSAHFIHFLDHPNNINLEAPHHKTFPILMLLLPLQTSTAFSAPCYLNPENYGLLLNYKIRFHPFKHTHTHKIATVHILVVTTLDNKWEVKRLQTEL